jgi:hypothetical protein
VWWLGVTVMGCLLVLGGAHAYEFGCGTRCALDCLTGPDGEEARYEKKGIIGLPRQMH